VSENSNALRRNHLWKMGQRLKAMGP
jgi:hypothetical protein